MKSDRIPKLAADAKKKLPHASRQTSSTIRAFGEMLHCPMSKVSGRRGFVGKMGINYEEILEWELYGNTRMGLLSFPFKASAAYSCQAESKVSILSDNFRCDMSSVR